MFSELLTPRVLKYVCTHSICSYAIYLPIDSNEVYMSKCTQSFKIKFLNMPFINNFYYVVLVFFAPSNIGTVYPHFSSFVECLLSFFFLFAQCYT